MEQSGAAYEDCDHIHSSVREKALVRLLYRPPGGKHIKRYFKTKTEASNEAQSAALQHRVEGDDWVGLSGAERVQMIAVWNETKKRGVNLMEALTAFNPATIQKPVLAAYQEFMLQKKWISWRPGPSKPCARPSCGLCSHTVKNA